MPSIRHSHAILTDHHVHSVSAIIYVADVIILIWTSGNDQPALEI